MGLPVSMAELVQEILSAKRIGSFLRARDVDYLLEQPMDEEPLPKADKIYIRGTVTWDCSPDEGVHDSLTAPIFQLRDIDVDFPRGQMTLVAGRFGSGKSLLLLALLGEARFVEGKISYLVSALLDPSSKPMPEWTLREGGVAYAPQVSTCTPIW